MRLLPLVGWREWVTLPGLGIGRIKAKVDTGARSSSLDALDVRIVRVGRHRDVHFSVPYDREGETHVVACASRLIDERWVTSSDGRREFRPVIQTEISLHGAVWLIEVTLTSRAVMGFRMLLGREALRSRFLVDPGRSFLAERRTQRLRKVSSP